MAPSIYRYRWARSEREKLVPSRFFIPLNPIFLENHGRRVHTAARNTQNFLNGGVVEWSIAPVLKTGEPKGSVGSNPTPSAIWSFGTVCALFRLFMGICASLVFGSYAWFRTVDGLFVGNALEIGPFSVADWMDLNRTRSGVSELTARFLYFL